jgi:hypothetical protein
MGPKMGSELGRSPLNLIYRGLVGIRAFGYMGFSVEGLLGLGAFGYMLWAFRQTLEGYISKDIYIPYPIQKSRKRICPYPFFEWDMLKDIISLF